MKLFIGCVLAVACLACDEDPRAPAADAGAESASPDVEVAPDVAEPDVAGPETSDGLLAPPAQGFQIKAPIISVPPATEETYCYYFTVPGDAAVGVKRWQSQMTAGSHHLIVYFTAEAEQPDGTITTGCDGFGRGGIANVPVWTYSAQLREAQMVMPDGVGMQVAAQQHGYVQMHYLNPTLEPLDVQVVVNAETFDVGATYTKASAFVTYNTEIAIPGGVGQAATAGGTCRVKPGLSFFSLSTHAHRRAVATEVKDGDAVIFASDDWEHPGAKLWNEGYTFGDTLTYRCDYKNDSADAVRTGPSADTDEMCMAVGYFYPADRPIFCINSFVVSQ